MPIEYFYTLKTGMLIENGQGLHLSVDLWNSAELQMSKEETKCLKVRQKSNNMVLSEACCPKSIF